MAVEDRLGTVQQRIEGIRRYARLIISNSFTTETLAELKGNAKDLCDDTKAEVDLIKNDIDELG